MNLKFGSWKRLIKLKKSIAGFTKNKKRKETDRKQNK